MGRRGKFLAEVWLRAYRESKQDPEGAGTGQAFWSMGNDLKRDRIVTALL